MLYTSKIYYVLRKDEAELKTKIDEALREIKKTEHWEASAKMVGRRFYSDTIMGKSFDFSLIWVYLPKLLSYLHVTLFIVLASVVCGVLLGLIIALPRLYKIPLLNRLVIIYISYTRGTPILIQLFLVYYGVPELLKAIGIDVSDVQPLVLSY